MSTEEIIELFHHRWAPPALVLVADRGGARFVELQRALGVAPASLRRAVDRLVELGYVRRNAGYGHPLRPEYLPTARGRSALALSRAVSEAGDRETLLRKWSVPVLVALDHDRRFSELRAALAGVTPRSLALALQDLEAAGLVRREVQATRPPSTLYRRTRKARGLLQRAAAAGARL